MQIPQILSIEFVLIYQSKWATCFLCAAFTSGFASGSDRIGSSWMELDCIKTCNISTDSVFNMCTLKTIPRSDSNNAKEWFVWTFMQNYHIEAERYSNSVCIPIISCRRRDYYHDTEIWFIAAIFQLQPCQH